MNVNTPIELLDQEPERYELREPPHYFFGPDRRDFLKVAGGGLAVCLLTSSARAQQRGKGGGRRGGGGGGAPQSMGAWLHIAENGQITLYSGKTEVGQNVRTSVTQALAEELRVSPDAIKVVLADTELCPNEGGTSGSRSTPATIPQVRRVGAAAREMLIDLAAEQLKVPRGELTAAGAQVTHVASKRSLKFGELTKGQKLTKAIDGNVALTPTKDWKVLGTSTPKVGGQAIVTGSHKYASDIQLPGMLHGKLIAIPEGQRQANVTGFAPPGSDRVDISVDAKYNGFISILAPSAYEVDLVAVNVREHIRKTSGETPSQPSHKTLFADLKRGARVEPSPGIEAALKAADHKLDNSYTIAYIAHAPLEPRAAVAEWKEGKLTVWTGTQQPFRVQSDLMQAFGLPADKVRVIVPDTGSGYGGKHTVDTAIEAAKLAKAAGKPVKVVWSREEEFNYAYFRPAGVIDVRAGVTKDGLVTAWDFHNYNSGQSAVRGLYDIPQRREQFHNANSPLKQGSYRALASTANTFAREAAMDELAHAVGMDPLAFRLKNLKDERLRAVFQAAAEKFGWGKQERAENHGRGIAGGTEKGSFVASCAEVVRDPASGKIRVTRVVTAFECGTILNPDHLKNQVEGAVVQGLGGALFEEIQFEGTRILNPAFSSYRVPRFTDTPVLETVLVNRPDLAPLGAGETPIIAVAPAVAQAAFEATGIRAHSLPLSVSGIKS